MMRPIGFDASHTVVSGSLNFIGSVFSTGVSGPTLTFPVGTQVGDICIVHFSSNNTTSDPSSPSGGWTGSLIFDNNVSGTQFYRVFTRVLSSGDISGGSIVCGALSSTSAVVMHIVRGLSVVSLATNGNDNAGSGSAVSSGFTKTGGCVALLTSSISTNSFSGFSKPSGWHQDVLASQYWVGDLAASSYTNGTNITETWSSGGANTTMVVLQFT